MVHGLSIYSRTPDHFRTITPYYHLGNKQIESFPYLVTLFYTNPYDFCQIFNFFKSLPFHSDPRTLDSLHPLVSHRQSFRFHSIGNDKPDEKTDSKIRGKGDSQNQQRNK